MVAFFTVTSLIAMVPDSECRTPTLTVAVCARIGPATATENVIAMVVITVPIAFMRESVLPVAASFIIFSFMSLCN